MVRYLFDEFRSSRLTLGALHTSGVTLPVEETPFMNQTVSPFNVLGLFAMSIALAIGAPRVTIASSLNETDR